LQELILNLADIPVQLSVDNRKAAAQVQSFFGGFCTNVQAKVRVEVSWHESAMDHTDGNEQARVPLGCIDNGRFVIQWDRFEGDFDLATQCGSCRVDGMFGLQKFLWCLLTVLIPNYDGLVLHAASVCDEHSAYLFPAPSGVGKSTLVRNSPDRVVLSDEGSLVRIVGGRLFAYGSPFRSEELRDFRFIRKPVRGIYFLQQAPYDRLLQVEKAEALQRFLTEVFLFCSDPGVRRNSFALVERVVRFTPTSILALTNGPGFWRCLENER